jgi:hypothetical protein
LCHKLVTVSAGSYQIIGYPMQLSHKKYHRNALLFNVAFVFPRDSVVASQLRPYHPVIRKLATMLESLELESEFLFRRADSRALQNVITKIYRSLNAYGECSVSVETVKEAALANSTAAVEPTDQSNKIHLKLYPLLALPPKHIPPYSVPLRVKDLDERWKAEWDLTLRQVIPFIDGVNYVARISTLSGVHAQLVAKCVRQLLYYEAVQLVDIFQFSNLYAPCSALSAISSSVASRPQMRSDARRACRADTARPKPAFATLVRMWCGLSAAVNIGDYFRSLGTILPEMKPPPTLESLNVHPRKFIQYGLINGFVRRVHAYPVLVSAFASASVAPQTINGGIPLAPMHAPDQSFVGLIHGRTEDRPLKRSGSKLGRSRQATDESMETASTATSLLVPPAPAYTASPSPSSSSTSFRALERYLDGEHHYDQLCCIFQRSFHQLDEEIRRSRRCIVIYK